MSYGTWLRVVRDYKEKGGGYVVRSRLTDIREALCIPSIAVRRCPLKGRQFEFQGRKYPYLVHPYNHAWKNERAVEVPIVRDMVDHAGEKSVLEVGNVLAHYGRTSHTVLDKYEFAPGVINEDVVDFRPTKPYDLIVSISTLEHIGYDETPCEPEKCLKMLERLRAITAPGGRLVLTFPLGYNAALDHFLFDGILRPTESYFLKRNSKDNLWAQTEMESVRGVRYGSPFPWANAIAIAIFRNESGNQRPARDSAAT